MTTRPLLTITAQMHNTLNDLAYALEYDEAGNNRYVPEQVRRYLRSLTDYNSRLHTRLEGMLKHEPTS